MNIFEAKASASGEELELLIYGVIGESWFEEGITARQVERAIKQYPAAKRIRVRLNSPGGLVDEGLAIRTTLQQHAGGRHVQAHVDGIAASAASVIAMGADEVLMHEGARMMLHEASTYTRGDKRQHVRALDALDAANDGLADIYATRTGIAKDEIAKMMAAETWLTAKRAVELKFADDIVRGKPPAKAAKATASFDLKRFGYRLDTPDAEQALSQLHALAVSAQTEEPEDDTMTYARIAIALGMPEGADENAILQKLDAHKTAAARDRAVVIELCEMTGKPSGTEALGVARAYAQSRERVSELEKQLAESSSQLEAQERANIFGADDADPKGRKFTPAMRDFWKDKPVAMLRAFAASAPYVATNVQTLKQPHGPAPAQDGNPPAPTAASGGGKTYAQMTFIERHQLKRSDPERFRALKQEAEQAGEI